MRARLLSLLILAVAQLPAAMERDAHAQTAPLVVLELFTSQGCSSCPAADRLLKSYAEQPGLIALSLPVDYWDHLGWKDTLASPKHTARQKAYAKTLGTGNIYTPQLVVGGAAQAIGSHKAEIDRAISRLRADKSRAAVNVTAISDGKRILIDVGEAPASAVTQPSATVWLAIVSPQLDVDVKRGENHGRTLSYRNVVRELAPVGMWSGKPMHFELPASAVMEKGARCAIIVQVGDGGPILGSTWMVQ